MKVRNVSKQCASSLAAKLCLPVNNQQANWKDVESKIILSIKIHLLMILKISFYYASPLLEQKSNILMEERKSLKNLRNSKENIKIEQLTRCCIVNALKILFTHQRKY